MQIDDVSEEFKPFSGLFPSALKIESKPQVL